MIRIMDRMREIIQKFNNFKLWYDNLKTDNLLYLNTGTGNACPGQMPTNIEPISTSLNSIILLDICGLTKAIGSANKFRLN